ncbi:hypothetical protein [Aquibacillus kalidii]|uniref:hypothetical protein n=1 Tax=Aquibacillus kalidii TaxID=2762597 RepID=UPI00164706AF|nr:hypothetical protein [Aquibacillus kalidii]
MKRSYVGVISLCLVLFLDIVFMQLLIHQYFFENYLVTLIFMAGNILLFPIAFLIYKKEKDKGAESHAKK